MSCNPKPEITCGPLIYDSCITISDTSIFKGCAKWLEQYIPDITCARQSDLNRFFGEAVCQLAETIGQPDSKCPPNAPDGSGILGSIYLKCLTPCNPDLGPIFSPVGTGNNDARVNDEIQHVYGALCDLKTTLNNWTDLPLPAGFIPQGSCFGKDPCCTTDIATLGDLLIAMMAKICCITGTAVNATGQVHNAQGADPGCPNCP